MIKQVQVLLATVVALFCGTLAINGACQAAAEYSAATAASASATAGTGSNLGSAVNSSLNDTSQQVGAATVSEPRLAARRARRAVGDRPLPADARAMESTRRARLGATHAADAAPKERAVAETPCAPSAVEKSSGAKPNPACKAEPQVEYPSSITLSFPK
jgi:type IV secretory pathway TrbL component